MSGLPFPHPASLAMSALNALLSRDEWVRGRLAEYAGRTVCMVLGPMSVKASIDSTGALQRSDAAVVPDVTLTLSADKLGQVPALLRQGDSAGLARLMHVEGDAGLANVVSEVAQSANLDIEAELARFTGDIAAVRVVSGAKAMVSAGQRSVLHMAANLSEYLGEESDMLVSRSRYVMWQDQLQTLDEALTRVEQRLSRFESRQGGTHRV